MTCTCWKVAMKLCVSWWNRLSTGSASSVGSTSLGSGRCQMRSLLTGHVGFLPTQYFTEYIADQTATDSQSLHSVQSSPMLTAASVGGQWLLCVYIFVTLDSKTTRHLFISPCIMTAFLWSVVQASDSLSRSCMFDAQLWRYYIIVLASCLETAPIFHCRNICNWIEFNWFNQYQIHQRDQSVTGANVS